jgi:hypothetical protein
MSTKSREIHVDFSLTANLGDFNFVKLGCILEDSIEPGEEFEVKFDELYTKIRRKIRDELGKLTHNNGD